MRHLVIPVTESGSYVSLSVTQSVISLMKQRKCKEPGGITLTDEGKLLAFGAEGQIEEV